jgi:hypothetical protein
MKKQYLYLIFLGSLLVVLVYFLMKAKENDNGSTLDQRYSDFAIEDTSSIDKIIISDADGGKAVIERTGKDEWKLNGKYKARIDAVHLIFKTAKLISVKSEVPKSAEANVLKTMSVTFKKVEYYSNGEILKTWYVGTPTRDHYGTYMLLERAGEERSKVPYVMEIKGFFGHMASRFFTDEKEWRDKVLYALQPDEIKKIEFVNNEQTDYGFTIEVKSKNNFTLYDYQKKKVNGFDTVSVRAYLLNFRKIAFETFNRGVLTEKQEDSLRKAIPFAVVTVTDKNNQSLAIKTYRKAPTPEQKNIEGQSYQYDVERLFAILPSGEVIIMQYGTFDKIWRAVMNFTE